MVARIGILAGGPSAEARVSRSSAAQVETALKKRGHEVECIELSDNVFDALSEFAPDVVFPVLHGSPGEDGSVQGLLEILGYPYVGSDVAGCAFAMNKHTAKQLFRASDIRVARDLLVSRSDGIDVCAHRILKTLGDRVVLKPLSQGSALGIQPMPEGGDIESALGLAFEYGDTLLVEEFLSGREITVGVLDEHGKKLLALPVTEILVGEGEWYDYHNRYTKGQSQHVIPPRGFSEQVLADLQNTAVKAHQALGLADLSRADYIVTNTGTHVILEVNAIPGMTPTSLYPDAAKAMGIEFDELMDRLVASAIARGRRNSQ